MTTAVLDELVANPKMLYRLTVDDYHRLIADGTLKDGDPFELLNGKIVHKLRAAAGEDPMTIGTHHTVIVGRLSDLNPKLERLGCCMRVQGPLTLPEYDEPEPDGAIVVGTREDYLENHPTASDTLCVIEVSDASLERDRGYKQRVYANSDIPVYVIINLPDRVAEVYTQPLKGKGRYGQSVTLTPKQSILFPAGGRKTLKVPVRRLLP